MQLLSEMVTRRQARAGETLSDNTESAFEDMLAKLRRTLIAARFSSTTPNQPDPNLIRNYELACAAVAAYFESRELPPLLQYELRIDGSRPRALLSSLPTAGRAPPQSLRKLAGFVGVEPSIVWAVASIIAPSAVIVQRAPG